MVGFCEQKYIFGFIKAMRFSVCTVTLTEISVSGTASPFAPK
jgi:hypothetical protein